MEFTSMMAFYIRGGNMYNKDLSLSNDSILRTNSVRGII